MNIEKITTSFLATLLVGIASVSLHAMAPHAIVGTSAPAIAPSLPLDVAAPTPVPLAGYWIQVANPKTGIGVFVDSRDPSNVVIGFGKDRAKEMRNGGTSAYKNCQLVANQFANSFDTLAALYWFPPIPYRTIWRKGQGMWLHVDIGTHRDDPRHYFKILTMTQRPAGTSTPPASWLP